MLKIGGVKTTPEHFFQKGRNIKKIIYHFKRYWISQSTIQYMKQGLYKAYRKQVLTCISKNGKIIILINI